jgi:hypothetical protein
VGRFGQYFQQPHLAQRDYHLFGKLKEHIAGKKCDDDDDDEAKDELLR